MAKCQIDGRIFVPAETAEFLAGFTNNPAIVREVLRPLAQELRTERVWEAICQPCAQARTDRWLDDNSSKRSILTDDEERYGW